MALMCRFQRQWAEVEALTCSRSLGTRVAWRDGTKVTEVGELGRFQSAPVAPTFPWHLRRLASDVVVVHVPNPTAEVAWLMARPSGRLVVRYQSDVIRQASAMRVYGPIQRRFLLQAAVIMPTSDHYLAGSPTLAGLRERCRVVPLGILPDDWAHPNLERVAALRKMYGGGYVLFSGRHRYYKGLEYLVRAARLIEAPVVIAGDGPERLRCEMLAKELGANVWFPGVLSHQDLVDHLHGCDVFAFPSCERSEAFGIAMLEAHACGKPVVATRLGTGVEFVNLDGRTGLNVAPKNPVALAEAITILLADDALRARMGTFAQRRVRSEFNAETVARREFELYREVLQ